MLNHEKEQVCIENTTTKKFNTLGDNYHVFRSAQSRHTDGIFLITEPIETFNLILFWAPTSSVYLPGSVQLQIQ